MKPAVAWTIAAIGMAIGASFGGGLGVTATSGPGICLKSEAIGLAVVTELPVLIEEDGDDAGREEADQDLLSRAVPVNQRTNRWTGWERSVNSLR